MINEIQIHDVVQFNEKHKWCGCLGIVYEVKICRNESLEWDTRYMVGVQVPKEGIAFIYCMESENVIERIGNAILYRKDDE